MNEINKTFDIVAIGEAMIEFNQRADTASYAAGFGGDTSNCTIAAARMGAKVAYVTQLGDDIFGDELMSLWQREGVDTQGVTRIRGGQTGLYFVKHGAQGHQFYYRRSGSAASLMTPGSVPSGLIESARWLHCSGISQAISATACDAVFEAISRGRRASTRVSYDLNYRPALWSAPRALAIARATLASCDLFLPSIDEVSALTGLNEPTDIIAWSHDQGARMVALKLGAQGSLVSNGMEIMHVAPYLIQPLDATGAGDCYAGALLARLSTDESLAAAARVANVAAALSTQGYGAVAPLPRLADVMSRLHREDRQDRTERDEG